MKPLARGARLGGSVSQTVSIGTGNPRQFGANRRQFSGSRSGLPNRWSRFNIPIPVGIGTENSRRSGANCDRFHAELAIPYQRRIDIRFVPIFPNASLLERAALTRGIFWERDVEAGCDQDGYSAISRASRSSGTSPSTPACRNAGSAHPTCAAPMSLATGKVAMPCAIFLP